MYGGVIKILDKWVKRSCTWAGYCTYSELGLFILWTIGREVKRSVNIKFISFLIY